MEPILMKKRPVVADKGLAFGTMTNVMKIVRRQRGLHHTRQVQGSLVGSRAFDSPLPVNFHHSRALDKLVSQAPFSLI